MPVELEMRSHKENLIQLYKRASTTGWTRKTSFNQHSWRSCLGSYAGEYKIGGLSLENVNGEYYPPYHENSGICSASAAMTHVFGEEAYSQIFNSKSFYGYSFDSMVKELANYLERVYDWSPSKDSNANTGLLETHVKKLRKNADKLDALIKQLHHIGFIITDVKLDGDSFTFTTTLKD